MSREAVEAVAKALDARDAGVTCTDLFHIPKKSAYMKPEESSVDGGPETKKNSTYEAELDAVYFVGHSLGLQPKYTQALVQNELIKWQQSGVNGHFEGRYPWVDADEHVDRSMAKIVGAKIKEICVMNTLSVNLHFMLSSFYKPDVNGALGTGRYKILYEDQCFPSDYFVFESQAAQHGLDPKQALLPVKPKDGELHLLIFR